LVKSAIVKNVPHYRKDDFRRIKVLGQGFDKEMINEEILSKLF